MTRKPRNKRIGAPPSVGAEQEGFVIAGGPVQFSISADELRFGRRDRVGAPQLVIRRESGADLIDVVIEMQSGELPILQRPIAHFPPEALQEVFKPVVDALQQSIRDDWSLTSPAEIAELGLVVMVAAKPELLEPLGLKPHDRGMRMDLTRLAAGKVGKKHLRALLHDAAVLDTETARRAPPGAVIAFDPTSEDTSSRLALLWIPTETGGFWLKRPYDRIGGRPFAEFIDDVFVRRLPPRTREAVEIIVRELDLGEFVDVERLERLWKDLAGRASPSVFEAVANRAWERVVAIEHFFSAGRFAVALARAHLAEGRPNAPTGGAVRDPAFDGRMHRLEGFEAESLRDAICKLVEAWEFAVGELAEAYQVAAWESGRRDAYDAAAKAAPDRPTECLAAFKRAGVDKAVVDAAARDMKVATELRNLWTHRGVALDDRFFRLIGTPRGNTVTLCGRTVALDTDGGLALTDSAMRAVAHRVGRSISDIGAGLAQVAAAGVANGRGDS